MIMKREGFVMMIIVLMMTTFEVIACSHCEKVESQSQKQVRVNPVKEGPQDPVIRGYAHNLPLIIDPDKEAEYLAERKDTINAYDVVEQMPCFPGGQGKLVEFIEENMQYPKECAEKGIYGRVIVAFVVERSGQLSNIRVVKSVHRALDKEALRIVNLMPRWIPGKQNGVAVRVKYLIPIRFSVKKMEEVLTV
jgi:TonB family protein